MLQLGKYCSISWDCTIRALGHKIHAVSTHAFAYRKQFGFCNSDINIAHSIVNIGNDVWIGCGAIILSGVNIADGAVIGAEAVVTKDVSPYEIVAGVPARHILWRFNKEIRTVLLEIKWWNFSPKVIRDHIGLFFPETNLKQSSETIMGLLKIKGEKQNEKTLFDC